METNTELANIVTHLFPSIVACWFTIMDGYNQRWTLCIYSVTMTTCFWLSTVYHTGCYLRLSVQDELLTFDQLGIVILMWGSNLPIIFHGFRDDMVWKIVYLFLTTFAVSYIMVTRKLGLRYLFALATVGWIQAFHMNDPEVFDILIATFSIYFIGLVCYFQNFHTMWHLITTAAAFNHYVKLKSL